jgi:uncharacterized protein YndB with AHSA1/START domain
MPVLLHSEVDIKASASRVWDILTHLDRYGEWNPFVTEASGTLRRGEFIDLVVSPPDLTPFPLHSKVLDVDAVGRIAISCDRATDHTLVLEPTAVGVHVVQIQRYQRDDPDALDHTVGSRIQVGLDMMNSALKARAER